MSFPHAFVAARLLPKASSLWVSRMGASMSEKLTTKPFVALLAHLGGKDGGPAFQGVPFGPRALFIVSPEKPTGPYADHYLPLGAKCDQGREPLHLNLPLSQRVGSLYLHTQPVLFPDSGPSFNLSAFNQDPPDGIERNLHQLTDDSYARLRSFLLEHPSPWIPTPTSGGPEVVGPEWETFEGVEYEYCAYTDRCMCCEVLPFSEDVLSTTPSIHDELVILQQLHQDFLWRGVTTGDMWLRRLRASAPDVCGLRLPHVAYPHALPSVTSPEAHALASLPIPVDGEPVQKVERNAKEEEDDDHDPWFDDGPFPEFDEVKGTMPNAVVPTQPPRVVVLDIFGVILDRTAAVLAAVTHLRSLAGNTTIGVGKLAKRFIESEALEGKAKPGPYLDVARRALVVVSQMLKTDPTEGQIAAACDVLLHPPDIPHAREMVRELADAGFKVVGLSAVEADTFDTHYRPQLSDLPMTILPAPVDSSGLYSQCKSHVEAALHYARTEIGPPASPDQVVVVSTSSVRVLEPACRLGMVTGLYAHLEQPEPWASQYVYTVRSSLAIDSLKGLPEHLSQPSSWTQNSVGIDAWGIPNARVHGIYQANSDFNMGAMRRLYPFMTGRPVTIWRAANWLTGELVVLKFAMPEETNGAVPYEAAVYKLLADHPAVPFVHWHGKTGGADVLVMDALGPTLDDVRRLCRGKLSLKSVLMIGLQAINFIEFAHSKGVILRDIKPNNMAVAFWPKGPSVIYQFDFGLAKLYVDPSTGKHIPLRTGRTGCGTLYFSSHHNYLGLDQSRRDDIEMLGHTMFFLLHGTLPWMGTYAPTYEAKLERIGEMKTDAAFDQFLARSPQWLADWMRYARGLAYEEKPDYAYLRGLLEKEMAAHGWTEDGVFDWTKPGLLERGTLHPDEYKLVRDPDAVPNPVRHTYLQTATWEALDAGHTGSA